MNVFPKEDKHPYLILSLVLVVISIAIFIGDKNYLRACQVVASMMNLAGVYWIAAGVDVKVEAAENTATLSKIFDIQFRRTKFGLIAISLGSFFQILAMYLPS